MSTTDFFRAGRTYTDGNGYKAPEVTTYFHVEHVTRHPERGHLRAIGWSKSGAPEARWHGDFRDEGEAAGWTELSGPLLPSEPLIVRRVDCSVEPALEDENPELLVCCVAEDGRPVALLLDDEARAKLAGLFGYGRAEGKGTGTTGGEPTPPPSRFNATPLDVDVFLRQHFAEDVYLRYQQVIGNLSVSQAARDARMGAALRQVGGEPSMAELIREVADEIDPRKGGGPYPAVLLCSQHNGFGPCPGAPACTPGGAR
ncbi:hypothetical protein [Streptomyces sp. NPDC048551]|uniref:hypothetical protein n=1 Tax=Streptomyces sp. NPDC048551 TaxID=3155758 RepID=UPI00341834CF